MLDTVASLETGCPRLISSLELADFPLPAADPIWLAPDAVAWAQALVALPSNDKTLADALAVLFVRPGQAEPACLAEAKWQSGSFAWLCLILAITREVVELGEGKRRARPDAPPATGAGANDSDDGEGSGGLRWASWAKDDAMALELAGALERWRRGWDFDTLTSPVLPTACEDVYDEPAGGEAMGEGGKGSSSTGSSSSRPANPPYADVYFCREAVRPLSPSLLPLCRTLTPNSSCSSPTTGSPRCCSACSPSRRRPAATRSSSSSSHSGRASTSFGQRACRTGRYSRARGPS